MDDGMSVPSVAAVRRASGGGFGSALFGSHRGRKRAAYLVLVLAIVGAAAFAIFAAYSDAAPPPAPPAPQGLNIGDRIAPLDVSGAPQFGWLPQAPSGVSDDFQTAYEIQVNLASDGSLVWDSGQVNSSAESYVAYTGPSLTDGTSYTWTVRTWDSNGDASPYATPATFDMGLGNNSWSGAQWIRRVTSGNDKEVNYSLYLKDIALNDPGSTVTRARVYIGAVEGLWELHANGHVIDTQYDYGAPGELFYDAENITSQAQAAESGSGTLPIGVKYASWPTNSNEGLSRPQGPVTTATTTNAASAAGATTLTTPYVAGYTPSETLGISVNSQFLTSSGSPTGGTFTITDPVWGTTAPIAWNASSTTIAAALNALTGSSGWSASGGALPGTGVTITVSGSPLDHTLTVNGSGLTGGTSPSMAMTQPQTDTLNSVTTNESLAVTGSPTGGTFTLTDPVWGATGTIPWNATATQVAAALNAISSDGNSFAATGGPLPGTPVVVTLQNAAAAGANLPPATTGSLGHILTVTNKAFTGGSSPSAALTSTDILGFSSPLTGAYASGTPIVSENGPDGILAKVVIDYADGTEQTVVTNPSWLVTKDTEQLTSTVTNAGGQNAGIFVEYLDGRQLGLSGLTGWDQPGYTPNTSPSSATAWLPATSMGVAPLANPASCTSWDSGGSPCGLTNLNPEQSSLSYRIVHPVSVTTLADGTVEADFGNAGNYIPVVQFNNGVSGNLVQMYGSYRLDHGTLATPSAVGATSINVTPSTSGGFAVSVGDPITVDGPADGYGAGNPEAETVTSIDGSQSLTTSGSPTGGTFTLTDPTWGTTTAIAYNASAATVAAALNALPGSGGSAFNATGGPLPGTGVTITENGAPAGNHFLTTASSFTGGSSPKSAVTTPSTDILGLSTPLTLAHGMTQSLTPTGTSTTDPSAGTFKLTDPTWGTTATIPYNATAAQVATALNALPGSGGNAFAVSGSPLPGAELTITLQNAALSGNHALTTSSVSFTGGSISVGPTPVWVQGARIGKGTLDTQGANLNYQYTETAGTQTTDFSVSKGWRYLEIDNPGETLSPSQIWAVATSENAPVSNSLYSVAGNVTQDTAAGAGPAIATGDQATFTSSNTALNNVFQLIERSNLYGGQMQWNDSPDRQDGQFLGDTVNQSFATTEGLDERSLTRQGIQEMIASQNRFWLGGTLACGSATATCVAHTAVVPGTSTSGTSLGPPGGQFGVINAVWPSDIARDIPDYTEMFPEWVMQYYQMTGDKATLQSAFAAMQNVNTYVLDSIPTSGIFSGLVYNLPGGGSTAGTYPNLTESLSGSYGHGILDWGSAMRYNMPWIGEVTGGSSEALIDDRAVEVFRADAQAAAALGDTADATTYTNEMNNLISAINSKMVDSNGLYDDGEEGNSTESTLTKTGITEQHAQAFAVTYGVAPASKYPLLGSYIASQGMQAGAMDWAQLETSLNDTNQPNALVNLLTNPNTDGPAKILAEGGTTMWEVWDPGGCSYSPCYGSTVSQSSNESFSHGWGTAGLYPILRGLLGLTITGAGASTVQIQPPGGSPLGGGLTNASGTEQTERGQVSISWSVDGSGHYSLTTGIPDNVAGTVKIPDPNNIPYTATGGGGPVAQGISNGYAVFSVGSSDPTSFFVSPLATTASLSGTPVNGYYTQNPTVTLTATDTGGPGVASTMYQVDGGGWQAYTVPFTITGDGAHTLQYYSTDNIGSVETTNTLSVAIDSTPPATSIGFSPTPVNGATPGAATVTLTPSDATSGVASTMYSIDGGAPQAYTLPFVINTPGGHTITYYSTDVAGNVEATKTASIATDSVQTTSTITGNVPATLGVTVSGSSSPTLGTFAPNTAQTYSTTMNTSVTTSGGSATLTAIDPSAVSTGYLVNNAVGGPYALASPFQIQADDGGTNASTGFQALTSGNAITLLSYLAPVSNDPVTISFKQPIGATEPLRTGTYSKAITLTLSTTSP
jgi:hypothetical protein